jgi:hypothetical protein
LLNQVAIDLFTDPGPVAAELVTGPIAATVYASQVLAFAGPFGLEVVNAWMTAIGVDCRNLSQNSYGLVEASVGAGSLTLSSKDESGALVVDPTSLSQCTLLSQGP